MNRITTLTAKPATALGRFDRDNGMEMIQVVFSIAIAVILGTIVFAFVTNSVNPSMNSVNTQTNTLFSDIYDSIDNASKTGVTSAGADTD